MHHGAGAWGTHPSCMHGKLEAAHTTFSLFHLLPQILKHQNGSFQPLTVLSTVTRCPVSVCLLPAQTWRLLSYLEDEALALGGEQGRVIAAGALACDAEAKW